MIKKILFTVFIGAVGVGLFLYIKNQRVVIKDSNEKVLKFKKYYQVYNQWIKNKSEGYSIEQVLTDLGYKNIAIYGNGEIGCRLYEDLRNCDIKVSCFIDKKANDLTLYNEDDIAVYGIDEVDKYKDVDAIIVTTVNIYEEIEQQLLNRSVNCDIRSLEDLLINMTI